jgi:hypothetical protein
VLITVKRNKLRVSRDMKITKINRHRSGSKNFKPKEDVTMGHTIVNERTNNKQTYITAAICA